MIGTVIAKKSVADAFAAINNKDLDKFMAAWSNDAAFMYPGDIPQSGIHRGKENIRAWFEGFFNQFPGLTFNVKQICAQRSFDISGSNVLCAHWDLSLRNIHGRNGVNSGVTVITVKRGKVVEAIDYIFDTGNEFKENWHAG